LYTESEKNFPLSNVFGKSKENIGSVWERSWMKCRWYWIFAGNLLIFSLLFSQPADALAMDNFPAIHAKSFIMMDYDSGAILKEENMDQARPPASMTKMMSAFVVLDQIHAGKIHWDDVVTVSKRAASIKEANIQLLPREKMTVRELFRAMLIQSANDATVALAEYVGGTEEGFVTMMNKKAKALGMLHTHYRTATGLDLKLYGKYAPKGTGDNVMAAHDAAILASRLIHTYPEVLETTSIPKYTFRSGTKRALTVHNSNLMLPGLKHYYSGVDGIKTGHTDAAGYCFTGTARKNDFRLITVVMGTNSEDARFLETKKLFDYGFSHFKEKTLVPAGGIIPGVMAKELPNGMERSIPVVVANAIRIPVNVGESNQYKIKVTFRKGLKAPLHKGDVVGKAVVTYQGRPIEGLAPTPVVAGANVEEASWIRLFLRKIGDKVSQFF
jgi:D-alanyl-D-alanine carboxypeptidase (penicillin-binding protein 5/6)